MPETVNGFASDRTKLIDDLIAKLESRVTAAQERAYRRMLDEFISRLEVDNGRIKNTRANRNLLNSVDNVFNTFQVSEGIVMLNEVIKGVDSIIKFNNAYFAANSEIKLANIEPKVREQMNEWLGIKEGKIKNNGYLDKIIKDSTMRNEVKDLAVKNIITQNGFMETKKQLSDLMVGKSKKELGQMQKYYRNFVYDTYSVSDRLVGIQYAENVGYEFAIYEGGLIATSRIFCRERNGKVFHKSEIAKFDPKEAKPPDYNPFTDLGGYACRHHLNWVSNKLAAYMGKNINDFVKPG